MKLTELRKLEKGTLLRLKGTGVIFKLQGVDEYDDGRPCNIQVIEAEDQVLYGIGYTSDDSILDVNDGYYNSGWIYNNKTLMRKDTNMTRYEFDEYVKQYRYVVTVRDLEVYEEDICVRFDEHIDPRDLISCGSSPAQPLFADEVAEHFSEQDGEYGVLPISAARQFVNVFNSRKVTIQLINAAIARAAQDGKQNIRLADVVNHQVSEEIKDLYRRAGYNVAVETIQW